MNHFTHRRSRLTAALFVGASCLAVPMVASASGDDAGDVPSQSPAVRPAIRLALVAGDLDRARVVARRAIETNPHPTDRAAIAELLFVADAWAARGGVPSPAARRTAGEEHDDPEDWPGLFAAARARLASGGYADAADTLERLEADAPDDVATARASELRALGRDLAAATRRPPAVVPPQAQRLDEGTTQDEPRPPATSRWYGWQTLLADGAAIAATPLVPALGLGGYLAGSPTVHLAHGRPLVALASLGARVGAPIVFGFAGLMIGQATCTSYGEACLYPAVIGSAAGVLLGGVSAIALDAAVLAREKVERESAEENRASVAPRFYPSVAPRRTGERGRPNGIDIAVTATF